MSDASGVHEKIRELWQAGKTSTEIAIEVGVSRSTVTGRVWRLGLMRGQKTRPPVRLNADNAPRLHECAYPLWPFDAPPDGRFCRRPTKRGSSYCPVHHAIVWRPLPVLTRSPNGRAGTAPGTGPILTREPPGLAGDHATKNARKSEMVQRRGEA